MLSTVPRVTAPALLMNVRSPGPKLKKPILDVVMSPPAVALKVATPSMVPKAMLPPAFKSTLLMEPIIPAPIAPIDILVAALTVKAPAPSTGPKLIDPLLLVSIVSAPRVTAPT